MIKEIIVVEGKDDVAAIKRAVEAETIITGGFALTPATMERIKTAAKKRGVIIFTDPDFAGEKIRNTIASQVPNCKHAFLPKEKALKDGNIGIENASPENILIALKNARSQTIEKRQEFLQKDLIAAGLIGNPQAAYRRDEMGKLLGIGYGNAKQFLNRLNHYGVTREEWQEALKKLEK
ncbi:ribonuclease M5 [Clostridium aceticum]|uniref:Ribonuclease M5 n=1 Tax=Clostridium aceticum TaxID=84022 RepID=A0A0D8IAU4_9CLOT|nr:ribonuclease M5 [Clostridium aceticum]AKL93605.1 ribonuclease M5 [Clostridium aceticum]KJF27194.1 DNA primase [Clostridium aceticum]